MTRTQTERLTGKAWKAALSELRSGSSAIERVLDKCGGWSNTGDQLRALIEKQERQHRRFAPAGYRHRLPVQSAVDYFMVRIFADALAKEPGQSAASLEGIREDYARATILVQSDRNGVRGALEACGVDLAALAAKYDYTELVGDS